MNRIAFPLACVLVSTACVPSAQPGTCFVDDNCGLGLACIDGTCQMPGGSSTGDDGIDIPDGLKLDVGGAVAEIPGTCQDALAIRTNAGCEFWAVDLPNGWLASEPFSYDIAANQQFAVVVANVSDAQAATVSIYSSNGATALETATIAPLHTHTFRPPMQNVDPTKNGGADAYRISSDVPITAYQFQPLDNLTPVYSNDASSLLPAHVLEADYLAVTSDAVRLSMYPPGSFETQGYDAGAFVSAVATVDGTHVSFYPTAELADGPWEGAVLNRGQVFTILSKPDSATGNPYGNLSGTRVIADHPIAVFSGNVSAREPATATKCCLDHVEHQMLPLVAWGASYIAPPPPLPADPRQDAPATYRITAAFDGTQLQYGGSKPAGAPDSLDANETAAFASAAPLVVSSDPEHPFAVTQFLFNGLENPTPSSSGDPSMIAQPSISQLQTRYVFLSPAGYAQSTVTIFAPQGADVTLDGQSVTQWQQLPPLAGESWSYARVPIDPGAHVLISDKNAGIDVYGFDANVSYAYAGGSAVERISEAPPIP